MPSFTRHTSRVFLAFGLLAMVTPALFAQSNELPRAIVADWTLLPDGTLKQGHAVLVAPDGTISADGQPLAVVGLYMPNDPLELSRRSGTAFTVESGLQPAENARVLQGFLEQSNVDPVAQIARMIEVGRRLVEAHGADVLIMGCAGMAAYRDRLETEIGVPVVEPCQAAASMAIGQIRLGWTHRPGEGEPDA